MNLAKHRPANLAVIREALAHITAHGTIQERAALHAMMQDHAAISRGYWLLLALMPAVVAGWAVNAYILRDSPTYIALAVVNAAFHLYWLYHQHRAQAARELEQGRAILALLHLGTDLDGDAPRVTFAPPQP